MIIKITKIVIAIRMMVEIIIMMKIILIIVGVQVAAAPIIRGRTRRREMK